MKLKDVLQELKKYNIEFDTNIKKIKKVDNEILFEIDVPINEIEDTEIKKLNIKNKNEKYI